MNDDVLTRVDTMGDSKDNRTAASTEAIRAERTIKLAAAEIRRWADSARKQYRLFKAVEREVAALRRHIRIGRLKGQERRRLRDTALVAYMQALTTPERDAAFLRTYSVRLRDKTATSWEIPNTVATTLEDIAARVSAIAAERDRLQVAMKRIVADKDIGCGGAWHIAVAEEALESAKADAAVVTQGGKNEDDPSV